MAKVLLQELSAAQFVAKLDLYNCNSKVNISVGKGVKMQEYDLPKNLVCHYSTVFDRAFNGPFKESKDNKYNLSDTPLEAFEMVIQWMFLGQVVLGMEEEDARTEEEIASADISRFLEFFALADEINLLGPFDSVLRDMKMILRSFPTALLSEHIQKSALLPPINPVRKLFAEACVQAYLYHTQATHRPRFREWNFEEELNTLEGFASDLLRAVGETSKLRRANLGTGAIIVRDPISNKDFSYY